MKTKITNQTDNKLEFKDLFKSKEQAVKMFLRLERDNIRLMEQYLDMACFQSNCCNRKNNKGKILCASG